MSARTAQTARLLAVASEEHRPFFRPSLRSLVQRAVDTDVIRSAMLQSPDSSEDQIMRAEDNARAAKNALLDHLLLVHAIDRDLAAKIGGVL